MQIVLQISPHGRAQQVGVRGRRLLQPLEGIKNWDMALKLAQERIIKEWETFYYNWVIHICLIAQNNGR
jgi:hypothetical protein